MKALRRANYALMRLMARVMPSCKDISGLISQSLDHRLPLQKRLSIRLHVGMCGFCRRYEEQLHLLRHGFSCYGNPEKNPVMKSLSPAAKARMESALADCTKR